MTVSFQLTRMCTLASWPCTMDYLDFLARPAPARVAAGAYLEIGLRHGDCLALAGCPSLGRRSRLRPAASSCGDERRPCSARPATSSSAARSRCEPLGGRRVDLAFIDGMHLSEFALRDFIGVERLLALDQPLVFDDILPRTVEEATATAARAPGRATSTSSSGILAHHRPDLICLRVDTAADRPAARARARPVRTGCSARATTRSSSEAVHRPTRSDVPAAVLQRARRARPRAGARARASGPCCGTCATGTSRRDRACASCAARRGATSAGSAPARCGGSCPRPPEPASDRRGSRR